MALSREDRIRLEEKANELRKLTVETVYDAHSGHLGGSLSMMDLCTVLYYQVMNYDKKDPKWEDRDRFVMSKGHAGIGLVSILADIGYLEREDLKTFNLTGSKLGIHLDATKVPGVDASTGSLGHGLSIALGMALAARHLKKDYYVYCLLGDGECDEGSVWEAAMATSNFNANNLLTFVDRNMAMIDGKTEDVMKLEPFADKWKAFGFETLVIDGHDHVAIYEAIQAAKANKEKPTCIILNTQKGKGVSFAEGDYRWHYGAIDEPLLEEALKSLTEYHENRMRAIKEG